MTLDHMKFLTAVIVTVAAIVILTTKIIELKLASLKLNNATKEKTEAQPEIIISKNRLNRIATLITLLLLFIVVFIGDFYNSRLGLIVVFICSVSMSLFIISPILHKLLDLIEKQVSISQKGIEATGALLKIDQMRYPEENAKEITDET